MNLLRRIALLFFAAVILGGCVTRAVVRAARDHDVPVEILTFASASVLEEGIGANPERHLYLCFARRRSAEPAEFALGRISTPYPFGPERDSVLHISKLLEGCAPPAGTRMFRELPIVNIKAGDPVTLPEGEAEAIIVWPGGKGGIVLAYATTESIAAGYRPAIDLDNLYVEHQEGRHYLLLLTPVTVVIDGVVVLAVLAAWGCSYGCFPAHSAHGR